MQNRCGLVLKAVASVFVRALMILSAWQLWTLAGVSSPMPEW